MNSSKTLLFVLGVSLFALPACGTLEKGTPVSDVTSLYTDAKNDNGRFSVDGYAYIGGDITTGDDYGTSITIYTEPNGGGDLLGNLYMDFGEGKNQFYVPEEFSDEDLVLYDNEGNALAYDDKAEFSFTLDLDTSRDQVQMGDQMQYFGVTKDVRIDKAE